MIQCSHNLIGDDSMIVVEINAMDKRVSTNMTIQRLVHSSETGNKELLVKEFRKIISILLHAMDEKDYNFNVFFNEYATGKRLIELSYRADTGRYLTIHEVHTNGTHTTYTNVYDDYVNSPHAVARFIVEYVLGLFKEVVGE